MPVFEVEKLTESCAQVFKGAGLDDDEAHRVAHSLLLANLMGHDSHGVIRVVQYVQALKGGRVKAGQKIRVVREADASAVVDGGWGFGQTVCHQAMELAMEKAAKRSVAVVEMFNSSHIGRLGEYVEATAKADMIGIVMCNNHGGGLLQHAFGGIDARMSPNPIAVGFPTGGDYPIVVDLTTSVVAEGKIRVKRNLGESLPEGWVIDAEGNPTTDPAKFYGPPRGAILPFGGISAHKGYALSVVVDVLSGALGGAGCSREGGASGGNGVFIMALDIGAFTGRDKFQEEMQTFISFLKGSKLMPGFDEVLMPGEMEARMRQQKEADGVPIDDETWRQICETGKDVGVILD
ncbi:MAG: Ldh family oxidoreductase [Candidatus Latescibacteria bacterium]|nr:Ldh family oxidoreductase [Candidatus Latescibacterota bacterium]